MIQLARSEHVRRPLRDFAVASLAVIGLVLLFNASGDRTVPLPFIGLLLSQDAAASVTSVLQSWLPLSGSGAVGATNGPSSLLTSGPSALTMTMLATMFAGLVTFNFWFFRKIRTTLTWRRQFFGE